jgi:hypothetical protein
MSDIKGQLIKDSYNYVLQSDIATGVVYRIGGAVPTNPIFQSGLTINQSFNYSDGSQQNGYVLTSDGSGNATWKAISAATPSSGVTSITTTNNITGTSTTGAVTIGLSNNITVNSINATTYYNLPSQVAGSIYQVQYNNGTTFGADANFSWNPSGVLLASSSSSISADPHAAIVGGTSNRIYVPIGSADFQNNTIYGGESNSISNSTNGAQIFRNSIIGGLTNVISESTGGIQDSSIVGGNTNSLRDSSFASIIGGSTNIVDYTTSSSDNSIIAGGDTNKIRGSIRSIIAGGILNLIQTTGGGTGDVNDNFIIGGNNNQITNINSVNFSNGILGGANNQISSNGYDFSSNIILGGLGNQLVESTESFIGGSNSSSIQRSSTQPDISAILGSQSSVIYSYTASVILGGYNNQLKDDSGSGNNNYSAIIGGTGNVINSSNGAGIIGSVIIGGNTNIINNFNRSVILGGSNISATSNDFVYVPSLNINTTPVNDDTLTQVLVRDGAGDVKYRNASTLGGGGGIFTGGTVTGPTTFIAGVTANTLSLGSTPSLIITTATTVSTGTNNVYSVPTNTYNSFHIDYNISGSSGLRAGSVVAIWDGVNVDYTDTSTNDIGNTTPVTFLVALSGGNAILQASVTTSTWRIKTIIRTI